MAKMVGRNDGKGLKCIVTDNYGGGRDMGGEEAVRAPSASTRWLKPKSDNLKDRHLTAV